MNEKIMETGELSEETQKQLKVVAKGAGLMFFGLVFSKILTYFYRLIIARYYGPETYGIVSIGLSVIGVLVVFLMLGMDAGIVRYVPEYKAMNDEKRVSGTLLNPIRISLPLSIIAAILIWFLSPYFAGVFAKDVATQISLTMIFQIFSFTLPFSVCYNFLLAACKGFKRVDLNVYTDNIFFSIALISFVAIFSFLGFGLSGIIWSYVLTVITSFFFILYYFNKHIFSIFSRTKVIFETKTLIGYSIPVFIGIIATTALSYIDTIFLGIFKNITDVGVYNAVLPTAKFMIIFSSIFGTLFMPIMIEYKSRKMKQEIQALYKTITKWVFFSGFPFAILFVFFSRTILNIIFGSEYTSITAFSSLIILGISFFIQSLLITSHLMLLVINKAKYSTLDVIFATLLNIILNIILIPYYGIIGAAIATSVSTIIMVSLDSFFAWKFTKMNPFDFKSILKSVFSGLISIGFIMFIYRFLGLSISLITIVFLLIIFISLYCILLIIFKSLDKNDVFILKEIERKSGIKIRFIRKIFNRFIR